jgi:uncharacterized protein
MIEAAATAGRARMAISTGGRCGRIAAIYRYPVKGLSAEPLRAVRVATGQALPLDRCFALARPGAPFDPKSPRWLSKSHLLMLMRDERLAELRVAYDDARGMLRIERAGELLLEEDVRTAEGRTAIEALFEAVMGGRLDGRPRLVEAPGHVFTDSATKYLSLINLETLRELERAVGREVHPLRLRANLYVEDLPSRVELDWVGRELAIDGSDVRFAVAQRIDRCAATNVDPETARRDMNLPLELCRHFGHIDCGVYLEVRHAGHLEVGQQIAVG